MHVLIINYILSIFDPIIISMFELLYYIIIICYIDTFLNIRHYTLLIIWYVISQKSRVFKKIMELHLPIQGFQAHYGW
jgi:hypothetical protein